MPIAIDLSRVPMILLAPLAELAALVERGEDRPAPVEAASALPVVDWVVAIDRWRLPAIMTLPESHFAPGPGVGHFVCTPIRVTPSGYALAARGWIRLTGHATERDPEQVVAIVADLEATCAALRAALLAAAGP